MNYTEKEWKAKKIVGVLVNNNPEGIKKIKDKLYSVAEKTAENFLSSDEIDTNNISKKDLLKSTEDYKIVETLNINKGVALTSTSDFFNDLTKGNGPKNSILALGYAGWGPGQLEKEIMQNSWTSLSIKTSFLFDDEVNNKWLQAYELLGVNPNKLSIHSGTA